MLQLSWGKLRKEPATRWFDWSFAPMPNSDNRFARQNCFGPPSGFPLTSTWSGIVHHLSGHVQYAHDIFSMYNPEAIHVMKILRDGGVTIKNVSHVIPLNYSQVIYANRFSINGIPFTRILDKLLGPCFKTGPKGIPNETVVDRAHIQITQKMGDASINDMTFKIHQAATSEHNSAHKTIHPTKGSSHLS